MRPNLDSLTEEIQQYLAAEQYIVFRGLSRAADGQAFVYWDTDRHPDYKAFLDCAQQLGLRLIHFHTREFSQEHREEALDQLEDADLPREKKRTLSRRIEELAIYEGFTCAVELSFDYEGRVYLFEIQTEWYEEWHDILDEVDAAMPDEFGPGGFGGGSGGGNYYSNN
ncbi:MAG: hypothetical protein KJZ79_14790 [Bryobacteraceae bacterium]|nr:hypothetical protein [Bryobacteraceae bacterium]